MSDEIERLRAVLEASPPTAASDRRAGVALGTLWPALLAVAEASGWPAAQASALDALRAAIREHLGEP